MRTRMVRSLLKRPLGASMVPVRLKTTSAEYVSSRARDATFEKFMDKCKHFVKVVAVQDLILANPTADPPSVSVDFLNRLSQKLHLNRGALHFLRKFPHIFRIYYDPEKSQPFCRLTYPAMEIHRQEVEALVASLPAVVDRLLRILYMSNTRSVPLRAIFKVWRELGLPDDFEDSVISRNPQLFKLCSAHEPNTHMLKLADEAPEFAFMAAVEEWRDQQCGREDRSIDRYEIQYSFKQGFPPGMRLRKNFRAKVKEWQKQPYVGPYMDLVAKKETKVETTRGLEKRAVAIVHEFLSLTVEKIVEVEKISHFRKWFGIDMNIRDLFLDHPGIFYMSTKGKRHTVFLREAYERGHLVKPNPVYNVRRKLLDLVILGRHGRIAGESGSLRIDKIDKQCSLESEDDRPIVIHPSK